MIALDKLQQAQSNLEDCVRVNGTFICFYFSDAYALYICIRVRVVFFVFRMERVLSDLFSDLLIPFWGL